MQIEHPRRHPSALDTALRATAVDELDERIGEAAVAGYEEAVTQAALGASETILAWWRAQPPDVVEAFLDDLRERDENAIVHVEELTETSGIELLGELLRDTGDDNGRQTYERAMRRHLNAIRAENAVPADSETPAFDAALATLDERTISLELGVGATTAYATRIARGARCRTRERQPLATAAEGPGRDHRTRRGAREHPAGRGRKRDADKPRRPEQRPHRDPQRRDHARALRTPGDAARSGETGHDEVAASTRGRDAGRPRRRRDTRPRTTPTKLHDRTTGKTR